MDNINELIIPVTLYNDVRFIDIHRFLSKAMNYCMSKDDRLAKLHMEKGPKMYSYSYLYPVENDKIYRKGVKYRLKIRSADKGIVLRFYSVLSQFKGWKIGAVEFYENKNKLIDYIETLTPAVITIGKNRYWTSSNEDVDVVNKIEGNALKKCKSLYGNDFKAEGGFIEELFLKNNKPILVPYKRSKVFGNKFGIRVKLDDEAQRVATAVINGGLLEKNSQGFGFVRYAFL